MKQITIVCALLIFATSCKAESNKITIPFYEIQNKTHVTVKIGKTEIPDILIDTGFAFDGLMIYNPDYKDSLDLSGAVEINIGGAGSGNASKALLTDSMDYNLGGITMSNQKLIMLKGDIYKDFPSNGIIGYSIFGHYVTDFDYNSNTITLHDSLKTNLDSDWATIPLYFKNNNIPWLDASVAIGNEAPISLSMYIDYAAGDAVVLLEKPDMRFRFPEETKKVHIGRGLSGDIYGKTGTINKLIIGPYVLNNVEASFTDAKVRSKQDNADAILGIGSLRRFNLIFDYKNKKLHLKPNRHFNRPY